jgi:hypothetical protein
MAAPESAFDVFGQSDSDDEIVMAYPAAFKPQTVLDRLTITLSKEEIESQIFSPETVARAVSCIRVYGIVIIEKVFEQNSIVRLGQAALKDFEKAVELAVQTGIDRPDWMFRELSCREEQRYELRQCPSLTSELNALRVPLSDHRGIMSILYEACAAPNFTLKDEANSIIAGDVGVFVSQPGARDQR